MAHTTCTVCGNGLDIDSSDTCKCNICKNYVHADCFDDKAGMCEDCSKEMDK